MADDRMKQDDLDRKMGGSEDENYGQQSPGRNPRDNKSTGQRDAGRANDANPDDSFDDSGSDKRQSTGKQH